MWVRTDEMSGWFRQPYFCNGRAFTERVLVGTLSKKRRQIRGVHLTRAICEVRHVCGFHFAIWDAVWYSPRVLYSSLLHRIDEMRILPEAHLTQARDQGTQNRAS